VAPVAISSRGPHGPTGQATSPILAVFILVRSGHGRALLARGSRCQSRWPGPGGLLLERTSVSSRHSSRNGRRQPGHSRIVRARGPAAAGRNPQQPKRAGPLRRRLHAATATARRPAGGCWRCPLMGRDSNLARRASAQRREQRREHQQTLGRPESPGRRGAYMTRVHQPTSRAVLTQWPQCPYPC
jgi:hypothetical protein